MSTSSNNVTSNGDSVDTISAGTSSIGNAASSFPDTSSLTQTPSPADAASARLPTSAVPKHYEIELRPDLETATFSGVVTIDLDITQPVDHLVCNAADLTISDAYLTTGAHAAASTSTESRIGLTAQPDNKSETLTLTRQDTSGGFEPGPVRLHIAFSGVLNDQLRGFYRSTFTDESGNLHTLAVTQFQATDARRAFPCWDEPALKATFAVSLVVDEGLMAISNCRETGREPVGAHKVRVRFATTMPMSTYLVAFVVGPLEATEPINVDGVPVRVVHRPGRAHQTSFALNVTAHALRWYRHYYNIDYPSDKIDLVAIPDFAFGAMENLGCITFREVLLLIDPATAAQSEQQRVADVINHELAHMWFGDLVTMRWWEGIWLNEAFATFMETACSHAYRPDWRAWSTFGRARSSAFVIDALAATRPIEYEVITPDDAEDMFDILTYEKGAALVRMLEQYLGADTFREGVRLYLRRHSYSNTSTSDLWDALETTSGEPVRAMMEGWINQGGHPVVQARDSTHGVKLAQRHFTLNRDCADDRIWSVPLRLRIHQDDHGRENERRVLLDTRSRIVTLTPGSVITSNAGAAGFFRTHPDAAMLASIANDGAGNWSNDADERHSLVDDAWALTLAGDIDVTDFVMLLSGFMDERDLNVWQALSSAIGHLHRIISGAPAQRFNKLIMALTSEACDAVARDSDPDDRTRELRAVLTRLRGAVAEDPDTISACRRNLDHQDPSLAAAALTVTARHGNADDFRLIRHRFETAADPQSEQRHLAALADFSDSDLVASIINGTLDGTIRTQDGPYLLRRALANPDAGLMAWAFINDRWEQLIAAFPSNSVARMLEGIITLDEPEPAAEVSRFLAEHPVPQGAKQVAQHLERLKINTAFHTRAAAPLSHALLNNPIT